MQKLKFLKPAFPLTVICVVIALILAFVNSVTADKITENTLAKKESAIKSIFTECDSFVSADSSLFSPTVKDGGEVLDKSGALIGYYADVAPVGFKGEISLIVGTDVEGNIIKVSLVSASETPGIGTKATGDEYLKNFAGLTSGDIEGGVDTVTGATISSRAVKAGIKSASETIDRMIKEGK